MSGIGKKCDISSRFGLCRTALIGSRYATGADWIGACYSPAVNW